MKSLTRFIREACEYKPGSKFMSFYELRRMIKDWNKSDGGFYIDNKHIDIYDEDDNRYTVDKFVEDEDWVHLYIKKAK